MADNKEEELDPVLNLKSLIQNLKQATPSLKWDDVVVKLLPDIDYTILTDIADKVFLEKLVEQTPGNLANLRKVIKLAEKELGVELGTNTVQLITNHVLEIYQSVRVGRPFTEPKL